MLKNTLKFALNIWHVWIYRETKACETAKKDVKAEGFLNNAVQIIFSDMGTCKTQEFKLSEVCHMHQKALFNTKLKPSFQLGYDVTDGSGTQVNVQDIMLHLHTESHYRWESANLPNGGHKNWNNVASFRWCPAGWKTVTDCSVGKCIRKAHAELYIVPFYHPFKQLGTLSAPRDIMVNHSNWEQHSKVINLLKFQWTGSNCACKRGWHKQQTSTSMSQAILGLIFSTQFR